MLAFGTSLEDPEPYQRLIERLIYLFVTRPDLAYSIHILSWFIETLCEALIDKLKGYLLFEETSKAR